MEVYCSVQVMDRLRASGKTLALITVAILIAAGTYAVASIPDGNGVITACWYNVQDGTKPYGTLRLIDPSRSGTTGATSDTYSCLSNETQITWNQQGPVGPQGPAGPQGIQGAQGARAPSSILSFTGGVKNRIFLSIPGIGGETTVKGHKGEIELTSASVGSGGASGRVKMGEIIVVKHVDKSSPTLFKAVATGKHFPKVTITFRKAGGHPIDYLKFTMNTVIVSSVTNVNDKDPKPSEQVSLNFKKLNVEFKENHSTSIHLTPHQITLP
jgi:type VI secretion system secreted protein Hcp